MVSRIAVLARSNASMSWQSRLPSSNLISRSIPASAMKRRQASVVSAKPGGTRTPALINSPREEHLPPTRGTESFRHSSNQQSSGEPVVNAPSIFRSTATAALFMVALLTTLANDGNDAGGAIDAEHHSGLDDLRRMPGADHCLEPVLAADDRRMAHDPANISDAGLDLGESRRPGRRSGWRHQDLSFLQLPHFRHRLADPGAALDDAGAAGEALEFGDAVGILDLLHRRPIRQRLVGHAPKHDGERLLDHFRRGADGGRRTPFLELLHHVLAPQNLLRPNLGAARGDPGRPGRDHVPQTLLDLVATQQPDVLDVGDHAVFLHDHADFAHLVPENRMEPVFDVEEMVFDVGEHRLGAAQQLVELLPVLVLLDQAAILGDDAVALGPHLLGRSLDGHALLDFPDVSIDAGERHVHLVVPTAVVVEPAGSGRDVEPRLARLVQRGKPLLPLGQLLQRRLHLGPFLAGYDRRIYP